MTSSPLTNLILASKRPLWAVNSDVDEQDNVFPFRVMGISKLRQTKDAVPVGVFSSSADKVNSHVLPTSP